MVVMMMMIQSTTMTISSPQTKSSLYKTIFVPETLSVEPTNKYGNPISFAVSASCHRLPSRATMLRLSPPKLSFQIFGRGRRTYLSRILSDLGESSRHLLIDEDIANIEKPLINPSAFSFGSIIWLTSAQASHASENVQINAVYEVGELFELGIQLTYLLLLLALLGVGSFFVIRQVLVRRELDLSAKELQEQVRSGDASATELFELGAVMLRRKFYPAATKYLLQAIEKWDGDDQDLAQVYNALGVSYVRDGKVEKGIAQFENAVKLQPGYVTAWNNLGDAYEKQKDFKSALKAFEEVLLFDPNNKLARPRRDSLKEKVEVYRDVPVKSKKK